MGEETLPAKSELELKYKAALDAIAGGTPWEKVIADSVLDNKPGKIRRVFTFLGDNLAVITSLIVAIAGISFGILQFKTATAQKDTEISQKANETKIARVQALQQLIPSLTSENADVRRYAVAALLTLYPSSSNPLSADNGELLSLLENIGEVGDAETLAAIATKLNDAKLKKKAAELYAIRAEHNRHQLAGEEDDKERQYLQNARADIAKALSLDPENAKGIYQLGRLLMDDGGDFKGAKEKFDQVISLVEGGKYPRDDEIYLRSYLNNARCLYEFEKKFSQAVCDSYRIAARRYHEAGGAPLDVKGEKLEEFDKHCK